MRSRIALALLVLACMSLLACRHTAEGFKADTNRAVQKTGHGLEKAGQKLENAGKK